MLLALPAPARAHQLHVFAQARGTMIVGHAFFASDIAARQVDVIARDPSGRELGRTKTDDDGNFTLAARVRVDYHFTVETPDHAASCVLSAAELPDSLPANPAASAEKPPTANADIASRDSGAGLKSDPAVSDAGMEALQKQIEGLRRQIDQSEQRLRLRDILGGIGYILGLAGIAAYMKSRQKKVV
jgi:nickel transport protein